MKVKKSKSFTNGTVYALETDDGYPIEVTDTFLPFYTKNAINNRTNKLTDYSVGDRSERWFCGVSVSSGCIVGCKFCATGQMKRYRFLTPEEIVEQVDFVVN
jgi:23S rRNA (adenine2503-C2)-methyltransferase